MQAGTRRLAGSRAHADRPAAMDAGQEEDGSGPEGGSRVLSEKSGLRARHCWASTDSAGGVDGPGRGALECVRDGSAPR